MRDLEQLRRSSDVVGLDTLIPKTTLYTLPCQMQNRFGLEFDYLILNAGEIRQITLYHPQVRQNVSDAPGIALSAHQNCHLMATLTKQTGQVGTDEAGSAGYQTAH